MKIEQFKKMKLSSIGKTIENTKFVKCKKSIRTFKKGEWYIVSGSYGDPQGAHEAGLEHMIMEYVNGFMIMDGLNGKPGKEFFFECKVRNPKMSTYDNIGVFEDYFFINLKEERKLKLNKIKNDTKRR